MLLKVLNPHQAIMILLLNDLELVKLTYLHKAKVIHNLKISV